MQGSYARGGPARAHRQYLFIYTAGQYKRIARIVFCRKWARARILHKGFQAAVGQLVLISDVCVFTPRANASIFPGSTPSAGPHESLIWQPGLCWMDPNIIAQEVGPCEDFA